MECMESLIDGEFFRLIDKVAEDLRKYKGTVTIVHHNDADGICSAAILLKLFELLDCESELICIEKVHPKIVEKIHEDKEDEIVIYTDLGGLAAEIIDKINAGRCKVYIIDHHPAKSIESEHVFVLDPELAGISGDIFISASTLNYVFCCRISEEMRKYAYLAVIGSVGDYHDRTGGVLGFDRFALDDALHQGLVKIKIEGVRERYYIKFFDEFADVIAKRLTTLGACGYEYKGYADGIKACIKGFDDKILKKVKKLEDMRVEKFKKAIERLINGELKYGRHIQWFHVHDDFSPMGVKAVGEFCQLIKDMSFIDENKYLIGFQNMPDYIPDIGKIELNAVKMSGRVPIPLERKILRGDAPGLDYLVPKASEVVNGFADATHRLAAATVIEKGKEEEFIKAFDSLIQIKS